METKIGAHFKSVLARLQRDGSLLESHPKLPSVCTLITGEPLKAPVVPPNGPGNLCGQ